MKKWLMAALAVLVLTAAGGTVMASGDNSWNFEDHLPFMQERHPDLTEDELEERFNQCQQRHEESGFGHRMMRGMMHGGMMGQGNGSGPGNGPGNGNGPGPGSGFDNGNNE